ncbi:hypothetical protein [Sinisalibacter aestuarii]|uniref:Phosphoadenosine phosphosulfate reductase n=1 Tax=Sinisalibacter aestuarii TaxID=2949426 RepID=A0ABQ5LUB9_9RHOB|nr:hypothetical protein [Sinisalibacter aestuarii]GKY88579.1 hypothetical protein STA1M1_24480 [Sinisalibacter aestuarii]
MKDTSDFLLELAEAGDLGSWRIALEDIAEERGYYDALGAEHAALFAEGGEVLLVSFEEEAAARARANHAPLGWTLAQARGWSSLVLLSRGQTWFRDPHVYAYFDRLVDDGFFDEFTSVIFLGAGDGGYAAAAFSVAAPGATLIALAPQATLSPERAGWDKRFPEARRLDFTSRYGYAAAMAEAALHAFVIHDPAIAEDAMHAQLFESRGIQPVRARHFGASLAAVLEQTGALGAMLDAAAAGRLDSAAIYRALRARRDSVAWLRNLLADVSAGGDPHKVVRLCRHVIDSHGGTRPFPKALSRARRDISRAAAQDKTDT